MMRITWICRGCGELLGRVDTTGHDPRIVALTAHAGEDIIETDRAGNLVLYILCEDCLETIVTEDESDFIFLRGPELH
jgi:hypothetical protein